MRVGRRIISLKDCVVGFGIPTTANEFLQAKQSGRSDYVNSWFGGLPQFRRTLLRDFERFLCFANLCDLPIVTALTMPTFSKLLAGKFSVVVLFSHFDCDHVEFHDGFVSSQRVLDAVPLDFEGILDLCVCHPSSLVKKLDADRPCLVKWTERPTAPAYWLMIYEALFTALQSQRLTYLEALDEIMKGLKEEVR